MPKGVYARTEKHKAICSFAGKQSAAKKRSLWACKGCGLQKNMANKTTRTFCSKQCFDKYQTHDKPRTYGTKHAWVRRTFGTPNKCEHCGTSESKKFEWANISGVYKLVREDWARLCCQCHRRYDLGVKNRIEVLNVEQ